VVLVHPGRHTALQEPDRTRCPGADMESVLGRRNHLAPGNLLGVVARIGLVVHMDRGGWEEHRSLLVLQEGRGFRFVVDRENGFHRTAARAVGHKDHGVLEGLNRSLELEIRRSWELHHSWERRLANGRSLGWTYCAVEI